MSILSGRALPRLLGAAGFAAALAWSSTAAAAPSCAAGELSVPFSYTGSDQTYVVPSGYTEATVYLLGAQGGSGQTIRGYAGGTGGLGAQVSGRMTVIPGETLTVGVGGEASTAVNGGGVGGTNLNGSATIAAGTGGGGTDIRNASRVAIAGGGGGGGNGGADSGPASPGATGGNGGASGSAGTAGGNTLASGPFGGAGGTVGAGGAAGAGCSSFPATAGSITGAGGRAFQFFVNDGSGNGGGGGGGAVVGGGGGGAGVGTTGCGGNNNGGGGGGAGGSSSTGTLTNATVQEGVNAGNGSALLCLAAPTYTISGTGSSTLGPVALALTGSEPFQGLIVPANAASFSFPDPLPSGATWNVTVEAKPANQSCTVAPASGTIAAADVTNLVLSCQTLVAQTQSLTTVSGATATVSLEQGATGGPVTGASIVTNSNPAAGTVSIIQVNGVQTLQFTAAANFVGTLNLTYTLTNGTATSDPATVNITVNPSRYNVGGTGSSVLGSVTLQLTSTEAPQTLVVPANAASWTFPTGVLNNTAFQVAVTAKPSNQSCAVTPPSGTVSSAAITNLVLACQTITAQNFSMTLLAGTTATQNLQTGATGGPFTGAAIVTPPAAAAGTASIIQVGGAYTLQFVAAPTYSGTTSLTYTLTSAVGTSTPATVTITVNPRPDPSLDAEVVGLVRGEAEAAKRFAETQIRSFNERLEQIHDEGIRRTNAASLSVSGGEVACAQVNSDDLGALTRRPDLACSGADSLAAYADPRNAAGYANAVTGAGSAAATGAGAASSADGHASPWALWLGGFVDFGSAKQGLADLNNTQVGVSGGIDYRFSSTFTAGLGLGYGHDKTSWGSASSRTLADSMSIAIYGSYRPSPGLYVDGLFGYSQHDYDSDRYVTATGGTARGQRDGDQLFYSLSLGYEYRSSRGLLFAPYGRIAGSSTTLDAFTETGAGIWNLTFAEQTVDSLAGTLGMRIEDDFKLETGSLTGRFRVEYTHDFEGSSIANLGYADLGLLIYEIDAPAFSRNYLTLGLGFDARFNSGTLIGLNYNGSVGLNGDSVQHLVSVKFAVPF